MHQWGAAALLKSSATPPKSITFLAQAIIRRGDLSDHRIPQTEFPQLVDA
jgi:hypothetical protein